MSADSEHQPEKWFWEADSDDCPHGPEPEDDTSDEWHDRDGRHVDSPQGVTVCLDAPAGDMCGACSDGPGAAVSWFACRARDHARPKDGVVPNMGAAHQPVTVLVGTYECLDRECDEYFTDDGDEITSKESCSHIRQEQACSCQRHANGEYDTDTPCTAAAVTS